MKILNRSDRNFNKMLTTAIITPLERVLREFPYVTDRISASVFRHIVSLTLLPAICVPLSEPAKPTLHTNVTHETTHNKA